MKLFFKISLIIFTMLVTTVEEAKSSIVVSFRQFSETYYDASPYAYALNNPLKYIDPSGTDIIYVFEDGTEYDRMEAEGDDVIIKGISKEPVVTWWYYKWYNKYYDDGIPEDHELLDYGSMIPGVLGSAASLMNAGLYAYEGNYSSATSNGFSAIPFGKVLKKGSKLLKFGSNAAKGGTKVIKQAAVHGNSLSSQKPTWGYKLYSNDGTFLKNGITSQPIPEMRYTQKFMQTHKMKRFGPFPNRLDAYQWEYQQNLINRGPLNFNMH